MKYEEIKINNRAILTTYLLDSPNELQIAKRPAVLVFPGGGYAYCSDREAEAVAIAFNNAGFNAFVLKYTVKQGFDEAFKDASATIKFLMERKEELKINKLLVCGFSAGAHLACSMGTVNSVKPDGMVLVYPPLIQKEWANMCPSAIDLLDKIDSTTPPTFIVHAYDDPLVPVHNAYWLMEKLDNANVPFEAHVYRAGSHGFSLANDVIGQGKEEYKHFANKTWMKQCITWIKEGIADLEFSKKEEIDESEVPDILKLSINELLKNEKIKEILTAYNSMLTSDMVLKSGGGFPLFKILVYSNQTTIEELKNLAKAIEKVR